MILEDLEPMTDQECQAVSGGFAQFLMGAMLAGIAIPVIKNLWNSVSGSIKLPGGIESKWDSSKDDSKDLTKIKDEFNKFQEKLTHLIPPFMNFKELNNTKKPRKKAIKYGFDALSDNELLAIILRTGTKEKNVLFLA
ncbi:UPF0758 domain-containing protein [Spiroplasma endosymbiont of Dactylopius coccus]|nr:hypothetical protein [Spiroplasma ixodetis]